MVDTSISAGIGDLSLFHNFSAVPTLCSLITKFLTNSAVEVRHMYTIIKSKHKMHVINLQWCDFVVWSPMEEPFVQKIKYDSTFMIIS